jgi:hypothetical protein
VRPVCFLKHQNKNKLIRKQKAKNKSFHMIMMEENELERGLGGKINTVCGDRGR